MAAVGFEIERKYLLSAVPSLPPGVERWEIEQGYLAPAPLSTLRPPAIGDLSFGVGRLRRTLLPDGSVACTHTIKTGTGIKRMEQERTITIDEFEQHWARTIGRRLRKTRWRVPHGEVVWEIDDIENGRLALAEVELQAPDQAIAPPLWLASAIIREVTDDPAYTNSAIAERLALPERSEDASPPRGHA